MSSILFCQLIILLFVVRHSTSQESILSVAPNSCTTSQFFNTITLECKACPTGAERTLNGLSCKCKNGYRLQKNYGDPATIECIKCPADKATSLDGWSCVTCNSTEFDKKSLTCGQCNPGQATKERNIDGKTENLRTCVPCELGTFPSKDGSRCVACNQIQGMLRSAKDATPGTVESCNCNNGNLIGGICFPSDLTLTSGNSDLYKVSTTGSSPTSVTSAYFQEHVLASYGLCLKNYNNVTACQSLSNMCVLLLYSQRNLGNIRADACSMYVDLNNEKPARTGFINWREQMPWLYYSSATSKTVLSGTSLATKFNKDSQLLFRFAEYRLNGSFVNIINATNGRIQLCTDSVNEMNAAYKFGTQYYHACTLSVDDLFNQKLYPLMFLDPYIEFTTDNGEKNLLPVPIRVLNFLSRSSTTPNTGTNNQNWILTRRFFLVDNVAAIQSGATVPEFVRYAKSIEITIQPQVEADGAINKNGLIYTPYITIEYDTIKKADLNAGKTVTASFAVKYVSPLTKFNYDLSVAMGVLCALAFCFAAIRTWSWTRRSGVVAFDIVTIVKLLAFNCAAISNVFLLVTASVGLYYLLFYKNQSVFAVFLPTPEQDNVFIIYISVAFALKVIDILHIIVSQCTVDIFFIDWERGKFKSSAKNGDGTKSVEECSIWRTYFCANEWNEIQTYRKCNRSLQIILTLFFLEVLGFIRIASADTSTARFLVTGDYRAPENLIFRYALIVAVFSIIGLVQWAFNLLIYEKFLEDKLRNYVDLCSVANVSVFIMAHKQFGYYIHGQSVHGTADVGLRSMYDQLQKEKDNLCAKRGLGVDSEQQTFMMALPTDMRENFDRLYAPFAEGRNVEKGLETYKQLNKFLSQFISRGDANNMKYRIVDRRLFEDILDCEIDDSTIEGHFYKDDGNSFGNLLFYGHELSLITFDLLAICVVDLMAKNIVLDGLIAWILGELIDLLRDNLSRKNLAKKTLVDDRFLI